MFIVQISLLIVTFLSFLSWNLSLMHTTQEVNPHPRIAPCANMWSVIFFFFFFLLLLLMSLVEGQCMRLPHRPGRPSGVDHTSILDDKKTNSNCPHISFALLHNVTCYTKPTTSRIHVNTTKLWNITCTLVATCMIQQSLECTYVYSYVSNRIETCSLDSSRMVGKFPEALNVQPIISQTQPAHLQLL